MKWLSLLGAVVCGCGGPGSVSPDAAMAPTITAFGFRASENPGLSADITSTIEDGHIRASTPFGGQVGQLRAYFETAGETTGATVTLDGVEQVSGATANDFASSHELVVTGVNGLMTTYDVRVRVPAFADSVAFSVGTQPYGIAAGDLDGDGNLDLVISNIAASTLSILRNTTAAGALAPTFAPLPDVQVGPNPYGIAIADMNADGKPDILYTSSYGGFVAVLTNATAAPGAVTLGVFAQITVGNDPHSLAVGDIDGDGTPDIVTSSYSTSSVTILRNNTVAGAQAPSFMSPTTQLVGPYPEAVAIVDVDGDGTQDLVTSSLGGSTISVLHGTGGGAFAGAAPFPAGNSPSSIGSGDFDRDGRLDLAVADYGSPEMIARTVSVLHNDSAPGTAAFSQPSPTLDTVDPPHALAVGDLSSDGKPDIVAANSASSVSIYLDATSPGGDAAITFSPRKDIATIGGPWAIAIADLNRDQLPDIALVGGNSNQAAVILAR